MHIVFLVSSLNSGGAERVATTLANAWTARGDRVTLVPTFSGGGTPFYPVSDQVDLVYLSDLINSRRRTTGGKRYLARLMTLRWLVTARKPDVVISFLPNVNIAALAATAFAGVPCVIGERTEPSMLPMGFAWRLACALCYRFADLITVQTDEIAVSIRQVYGGLRKVEVVPNPVPAALLEWEAEADTSRPRRTLLSLGRLAPEKQVGQIIECFKQLAPIFPDWDFDIWGDGPERAALQAQIDASALGARVRLRGRSESPWQVMSQADIFVMNSQFEGFPNALLEAMAVGLPCVAAACPSGPREITNDGRDALIFAPGDTDGLREGLERLMANADLRTSLGRQARASVLARYSLASVLQRWDDLIAAVRMPK